MPCHKDLGMRGLDNGVVLHSSLIWTSNRTGNRSVPDLRTWDPGTTRKQGKKAEMRHVDILRQSAERHIMKCGQSMPKLHNTNLEESRWHRRIAQDAPPVSKLALGLT
mmetsp:Transcript_63836/g.99454  ORF Transcript_63836/g.99454 Transcript_63836/m.99454 type:complete len:108 (-) Transcript_63836:26-349(-)